MDNLIAVFSGLFLIAATLGITALYQIDGDENSGSELSNFQSEEEFISYMNSDGSNYQDAQSSEFSAGESAMEETTETTMEGDSARSQEQTQSAEWVQTTQDRILISHGYPRYFNSVKIPGLELEHNISEAGGPMVTSGNLTVIEEQERVVAYDSEMNVEWEKGLNSTVVEMTRLDGEIILLTRESENECPIRPYEGLDIACTSVLRPIYGGQNDYTYTLSKIDINSGERTESMSFVASSRTQIEVTPEKTFIGYSDRKPEHEIMTDFILNEASVSSETRERVRELQSYDLTDRSMQIEIEAAIREHEKDNREALEKEFSQYDQENLREYEESTLMTVNNSDLSYEKERFDGRISSIESGNQTLLAVEFNGVDGENRVTEIRTLEGSSREIEGQAELFNGDILVQSDEEISLLDQNMEEINSVEIKAQNVETLGDRIIVSVRPEMDERTVSREESELVLFDSGLERLDSESLDAWLYSFEMVEGQNASYSLVRGTNSSYLIELNEEINSYETKASGQLIYQEGLYTAGEKVQKVSEEGEIEEELDLEIPRGYVTFPEARVEN
jgi:hypothetical protein